MLCVWVAGVSFHMVSVAAFCLASAVPTTPTTATPTKVDPLPGSPEVEARLAVERALQLIAELAEEDPDGGHTPAAAAAPGSEGPRRWLVDSGSAFDMIGQNDVPEWHLGDAHFRSHRKCNL